MDERIVSSLLLLPHQAWTPKQKIVNSLQKGQCLQGAWIYEDTIDICKSLYKHFEIRIAVAIDFRSNLFRLRVYYL